MSFARAGWIALVAALGALAWGCKDAASAAAAEVSPEGIRHKLRALPMARGEAEVHHFSIPLAGTKVTYVDLQYRQPLVEALGNHQLLINGGYWAYRERRRVIQGLLVVDGRKLAPGHDQGGVFELRNGRARMVRGADFQLASNTTLAIQCSPRLVAGGEVVAKLEAQRRAARTALCVTRDRHRLEAYLTLDAITLPELAAFLRAQGCREALNLDGGPSTAAIARLPGGTVRVGRGEALPYGLAFSVP